tara:strand:- start:785 stop:2518 length:1734 start_codon:yes stop_codon:yes gene_type:complete
MNQRYILGIATAIWGYQSDFLLFAILMALILEARYVVNRRWALTKVDFYQVANLTYLGLAGLLIFLTLNTKTYHFITTLMQSLPFLFFGLTVVMGYSTTERMTLDILFPSYRKEKEPISQTWNMDYLFLGICLLATGMNTSGATFYFPYAAAMIFWALYPIRQTRYKSSVWILIVCLVFLAGNLTHSSLRQAHLVVKEKTEAWIAGWIKSRSDPMKTQTAIGYVGQLKLSDKILFRISTDKNFPRLLKEASYDDPKKNQWEIYNLGFRQIPHSDDFTWRIGTQPFNEKEQHAVIYREFDRERALLPLPAGTTQIDDLPALDLRTNKYGTIQASRLIPSPSFNLSYIEDKSYAIYPTDSDLVIPKEFSDTLNKVTAKRRLDPKEAIAWIKDYFSDFRYSLYQKHTGIYQDLIATFLLEVKAGHCEYFASATALLLRQLGVHSRYVVGYSLQEYNSTLEMFVVRQRYAHAWAEASVEDQWVPVNTTPALWLEHEERNASSLQPIVDLLDNYSFMFEIWWNDQKLEDYETELYILIALLAIILVYRIYTGEQVLGRALERQNPGCLSWPRVTIFCHRGTP